MSYKLPAKVIGYGVAVGATTYGLWQTYHGVKYTYFNKNVGPWESRERYSEKQKIFEQELEEKIAAQKIAAAVAYYNPVDARSPIAAPATVSKMLF